MADPFKALAQELRRTLAPVARQVAVEAAEEMRAEAPELSGALKASIVVEASKDGATIRVTDESAPHVEWGTVDTPAQPFFIPAVRSARKRLDAAVSKALQDAQRTLT